MILEAKKAGVDAVKFESYKTENIISAESTDQFDLFKKYDKFGREEFRELSDYCNELKIRFLSTPLDFESADYLDEFMDIYKISSSDLTNIPFIEYVARKNKPILLSTGGATLVEIKNAVRAIEDVSTCDIYTAATYDVLFKDDVDRKRRLAAKLIDRYACLHEHISGINELHGADGRNPVVCLDRLELLFFHRCSFLLIITFVFISKIIIPY